LFYFRAAFCSKATWCQFGVALIYQFIARMADFFLLLPYRHRQDALAAMAMGHAGG